MYIYIYDSTRSILITIEIKSSHSLYEKNYWEKNSCHSLYYNSMVYGKTILHRNLTKIINWTAVFMAIIKRYLKRKKIPRKHEENLCTIILNCPKLNFLHNRPFSCVLGKSSFLNLSKLAPLEISFLQKYVKGSWNSTNKQCCSQEYFWISFETENFQISKEIPAQQ